MDADTALDMPKGSRGRGGNGKRKGRGRKEGGQEKVIKMEALSVKLDELIGLYNATRTAGTDFSEAIKATAEAAGLHAKNVRSFVIARAGEKFTERKDAADQLVLIFDEVGQNTTAH